MYRTPCLDVEFPYIRSATRLLEAVNTLFLHNFSR